MEKISYWESLTPKHQDSTRLRLNEVMRASPSPLSEYARLIDVSPVTLGNFLRGSSVRFEVISKIDLFVDENLKSE